MAQKYVVIDGDENIDYYSSLKMLSKGYESPPSMPLITGFWRIGKRDD